MTCTKKPFGITSEGESANLWTITNTNGISLSLTNWGATIVSLYQPDKNGTLSNIVLGYSDVRAYEQGNAYLGATCGRYANRIARGVFELEGQSYALACNDAPNHLHGGNRGFDSRLWLAEAFTEADCSGVIFTLLSKDGEEGYPGELQVTARYTLDENNRIGMNFEAESDKTTIINLTNHSYWNLNGSTDSILDTLITLHAHHYLPVDETAIPMGQPAPVKGTPFDFRRQKSIRHDFNHLENGYDHCMVIDGQAGQLRIAVEAEHPENGRKLILHTDRPGLQFYTGNFLNSSPHPKHSGFCLEPQDFPDTPNRPDFPSVILKPGERYYHKSVVELM